MAVARFLADKSVWARLRDPVVAAVFGPLVERGTVASCGVVDLAILYSARSASDHEAVRRERTGLPRLEMPEGVWRRAEEVQGLLARRGAHRAASIPDLLIAATAELHGVAVLHYDKDFDLIAEVTGQDSIWIVPRGSVA